MLFLISFLMVFVSSYLFSSVFSPKDFDNRPKGPASLLYILILMFAQVVLTFEVLSLFKAIKEFGVLGFNVLFLISAVILWAKKGKPLYIPRVKETFSKIWTALKKDKILMIMAFGFLFCISVIVILDTVMPVISSDALTYHLNRASYWLIQGSLNHFVIPDDRNLVMPINSEILYLWHLLFFKNDVGLFFISFVSYLASIFCVYNILEFFGFSKRRILWSVFVLASFVSLIAQSISVETDVLIAALVLTSITLFLNSLKEKNTSLIFFSSLAYALAMGTKSPAIIAFPGVFLLLSYFAYRFEKKEFYKPLAVYLGFLFFNFLVFSSYNYVLNFIQFGNIFGSESSRVVHSFRGGFKAFVANYIRYIFMMFDFSGFRYSEYVGEYILNARTAILTFLHIPPDLGVEMTDNNQINNRLMDVKMGVGILGFLLFLPSVVTSIVLGFVKKQNKKLTALFAFGGMFFINIFCLSFSIAYMVFSIRFITFLIVISSPVLALSYMKKTNLIKILILFFVMSYFVVMSPNLSGRQLTSVLHVVKQEKNFDAARERIRCSLYVGYNGRAPFCYVRNMIQQTPKGTKFGLFMTVSDRFYILNMLNTQGYKLDTLLPELADTYNYDDYDFLITTDKVLISTVLLTDTSHAKVEYKIDKVGNAYYPEYRPFSCVYEAHPNGFYTKDMKDSKIMDARCSFSERFFIEKGFYSLGAFNFKADYKDFSNFVTIYKNIKK